MQALGLSLCDKRCGERGHEGGLCLQGPVSHVSTVTLAFSVGDAAVTSAERFRKMEMGGRACVERHLDKERPEVRLLEPVSW